MIFLRWFGGFIILFWIIWLVFKIGRGFINLLLLFTALVFIIDALLGKNKGI